jgi:hypothetical protein
MHLSDDSEHFWPQVRRDVAPSCGGTEWLARKPAADDIDAASPAPTVEHPNVLVDFKRLEAAIILPSPDDGAASRVNLDSADGGPPEQPGSQEAASCPCK